MAVISEFEYGNNMEKDQMTQKMGEIAGKDGHNYR
jgi:hypothetical protein